jgi:hypothetical protein
MPSAAACLNAYLRTLHLHLMLPPLLPSLLPPLLPPLLLGQPGVLGQTQTVPQPWLGLQRASRGVNRSWVLLSWPVQHRLLALLPLAGLWLLPLRGRQLWGLLLLLALGLLWWPPSWALGHSLQLRTAACRKIQQQQGQQTPWQSHWRRL